MCVKERIWTSAAHNVRCKNKRNEKIFLFAYWLLSLIETGSLLSCESTHSVYTKLVEADVLPYCQQINTERFLPGSYSSEPDGPNYIPLKPADFNWHHLCDRHQCAGVCESKLKRQKEQLRCRQDYQRWVTCLDGWGWYFIKVTVVLIRGTAWRRSCWWPSTVPP